MKLKTILPALLLLITCSLSAQEYIVHPWRGKRVAYLGDSITDPRNKAADEKYWSLLEEWLDITPFVYALSGRQWNDIGRQTELLRQQHGEDFDAIIIFMGTNDYNNAVPLGNWYTEQPEMIEYGHKYEKRPEERMRRLPAMDADTYRGRINIALDSLKRTFPEKQIVLLTPIHRAAFHANDKNWQIPEDYANRRGEYLDAYVNATIEAGKVWSVPVIDLNSLCGLYPLHSEHSRYFNVPAASPDAQGTDLLHPNNLGHRRIAATLLYQLLSLPCTF